MAEAGREKRAPLAALFVALAAAAAAVASCINADGIALLTFKRKLKSDPLHALADWNASDDSPCAWSGVTCDNVAEQRRVVALALPGLRLSGPLSPAAIASLDALRRLSLQNNNLSGPLPPQVFNSTSLTTLLLRHNRLSPLLSPPSYATNSCNLRILDLSDNNLSGSIPASLAACSSLQSLLIAHNRLSGSIPSGFGSSFRSLEELDMSDNQLTGAIPEDFGRFQSLRGALNLSHNMLSGSIPASLGGIPYMVSLDLSHNNLSGEIPQGGSLGGQPAAAFSANPRLCGQPLRITCNTTSSDHRIPNRPGGDATSSLPPPPSHRTLILGVGAIVGIVFGNFVSISLLIVLLMYCCRHNKSGTTKLIAPPPLPPPIYSRAIHSIPSRKLCITSSNWPWNRMNLSAMSYGLYSNQSQVQLSGTAKGTGCFNGGDATWDESGSPASDDRPGGDGEVKGELVVVDKGLGADMEELLRSSAYMVGKSEHGIVYKVVLGRGKEVAVRRVDGRVGGGDWRRAAESMGRLRHPNIVPLLAYYCSASEKLLIHEFIPHGSLAAFLFAGGGGCRSLNWVERLSVMEGTAKALAYMHNQHCMPHGEVKSSNILLHMEKQGSMDTVIPYLADAGLRNLRSPPPPESEPPPVLLRDCHSRHSDQQLSSASSSCSFLCSYHHHHRYHLPPEAAALGDGKSAEAATEKWDVYAFGVVMMEVVTGRSAAAMAEEGKKAKNIGDMVGWVRWCVGEGKEILDPAVLRMGGNLTSPATEVVRSTSGSVVKLAMECTSSYPDRRPGMAVVAHSLHNLLLTV